ncbi:SMI1/KNR4 family protein [Listeria kieliensis]
MNNIVGFGHLSEEEIMVLELEMDLKFPSEYKNFLKKYNGGLPKEQYLSTRLPDTGEEIILGVLLGVNDNENFDLRTWFLEFDDELPPSGFVIGTEYNSGLFIMIITGDEKGVYFWDNAYVLENSSDEENVYWLSDTFEGFINNLSVND